MQHTAAAAATTWVIPCPNLHEVGVSSSVAREDIIGRATRASAPTVHSSSRVVISTTPAVIGISVSAPGSVATIHLMLIPKVRGRHLPVVSIGHAAATDAVTGPIVVAESVVLERARAHGAIKAIVTVIVVCAIEAVIDHPAMPRRER